MLQTVLFHREIAGQLNDIHGDGGHLLDVLGDHKDLFGVNDIHLCIQHLEEEYPIDFIQSTIHLIQQHDFVSIGGAIGQSKRQCHGG